MSSPAGNDLTSRLDILAGRLGESLVATDAATMRDRAVDSWALSLLRRSRGDELPAPAAVVFPACTDDVATVMAWASETRTTVIPRGAGSGVCGGSTGDAGSVVLDLSRMNKVIDVDLVSQ
jgi:FAD/FMN-containing dehydrogenase